MNPHIQRMYLLFDLQKYKKYFYAACSNETKKKEDMRETTKRRYRKIRKRFNELLGTDKLMCIYLQLAEEFDLSDERIRQILALPPSSLNINSLTH